MSLLRRLWISVVVAMAVVLAGAFTVSLLTARTYFEQQLQAQAGDGAVSLALSMSQQSKDVATAELLVTALFDGGHYQLIRFSDAGGKVLVERSQPDGAGVPEWLVTLLPMDVRPGQALVSDGWRQTGQVTVIAARGYAYRALWRGMLQLGSLMLAIGLFWAMGVSALLRWVRRPLEEMAEQAEAIGAGQFRVLEEPKVVELRSMARALNHMSERIRSLFAEQAARIAGLRDESSHDAGTGLLNRMYFNGELRRVLSDVDVPPGGCLGVLRIADLAVLNQQLGRLRTDEWLAAVGEALKSSVEGGEEVSLARLGGAEFAILLPGVELSAGRRLLEQARSAVAALDLQVGVERGLRMAAAVVAYRRDDKPGALLSRVDSALMRAEAEGGVVAEPDGAPLPIPAPGEGRWREMLEGALARHEFTLISYPVLACDGSLIHREFMLRLPAPDGGAVLTAGQFMPAAVRVGLASACDLEALRLGIASLAGSPDPIAINVAPRSLLEPGFLDQLDVLLARAGADAARISVEVSERGLDANLAGLEALAEVLARHGTHLGIEHFGRQLAALPRLYALQLAYLKLDGSFVASLHEDVGLQRLVKAIVDVARGLDVVVYAEQVHTADEWAAAAHLGVSGMTGPEASRRLAAS
ncbi:MULTISPECIES: EAL domain-containing protein [Zoogloea]|jgi:diguanylate cyclase (GGDEF)-like protein|uniref:EAL domain-containing protein n=1 Tax=Zoogloea oleivorans TaxID=1552750 RepID=A0A6C2CKY1_9RHOO|nr:MULTISPECIES: EAL domain-containing protein [Zoogloea]MBP8134051.1 EAL domain-containing protein [Zoogloea sp.]MBT9499570.1 EAL domain-containing protein [Zoogloea sp.]MDD2670575.1 LapD/MoxY N-terminal periplasmic domain-containing protein [Zoogloea sp.]MDY0035941.1 LapD/MoxY N-terminal periplasmic domain-containing protein [Zoogloea oleivorans]TYC54764.1 EAL domain-containing protein [Zoogloea oleivorans]